MGTRVHKVVGYGVTDFKSPKRFQTLLNKTHRTPLDEFVDFCFSKDEEIQALYAKLGCPERVRSIESDMVYARQMLKLGKRRAKSVGGVERNLSSLIVHEGGEDVSALSNVLVLIPASEAYEWARWDDPIDYFEESRQYEQGPRVVDLDMGLFPYTQGKLPPTVLGLLLWLGMTHLAPRLKELLYVYWC